MVLLGNILCQCKALMCIGDCAKRDVSVMFNSHFAYYIHCLLVFTAFRYPSVNPESKRLASCICILSVLTSCWLGPGQRGQSNLGSQRYGTSQALWALFIPNSIHMKCCTLYSTRNQKSLQVGRFMTDGPMLTVTMPFHRITSGSGNQTKFHVSSFEVCLEYQWSSTIRLLNRYLNFNQTPSCRFFYTSNIISYRTWPTSVVNQDHAYIDSMKQKAKSGQVNVKGAAALSSPKLINSVGWVFPVGEQTKRFFYVKCIYVELISTE